MIKDPTIAESTDSQGKPVLGDVVKSNASTVYVRWRSTGRTEPVSRKDRSVTFR